MSCSGLRVARISVENLPRLVFVEGTQAGLRDLLMQR